jgi:hypothetical protein
VRASILRQALVTIAVLVAIGIALTWLGGGSDGATRQLGWAVALAVGIAAFNTWQKLSKIKHGFVAAANPDFSLAAVDPAQWPGIDWKSLDDYAIQLEARGYRRLGDFSLNRHPPFARGMARYLADASQTQIVELQQFERIADPPAGSGADLFEVRVAVSSVVAGRIRVMVSDRPIRPVNYMIRDPNAVYASYPGKSLLELVELHRRLCDFVVGRTGQPVDSGYTLERYVLLSRERQRDLRDRLRAANPWTLLGEHDRFVENPVTSYSPGEPELKAVKPRAWESLEPGGASKPTLLASAPPAARAPDALRLRMVSGAHWFYWIAGLSAVNAVSSAMGSNWGFVVSLGASEVLTVAAHAFAGKSPVAVTVAWALNFAVIGLFVLLGWLASRPSVAAFAIGIALFALDTVIFLLAADWIGVAFHGLALYFLAKGLAAAREMKRVARAGAPSPAAVA